MKLSICWIGSRSSAGGKSKSRARDNNSGIAAIAQDYLARISHYAGVDAQEVAGETALLGQLRKLSARTAPFLILLDSRGKQLSSEELAKFLDSHQNRGTQHLVFAVGGADGFSEGLRKQASLVLSLSRMTLQHDLARIILLEQIYRAFTILRGHPYHTGH